MLLLPFGVVMFLDKENYWGRKHTYMVTWRYDTFCPSTTVIVEAKSIAKAWSKVQRQHGIPIDLVSIEEI